MNDLSKLSIKRDPATTARRRRGWRLPLFGLIMAGAAVAWWYSGGFAGAHTVEVGSVATAWPSQGVTLFNATGYVVPQTKADIASKATGRLEALEVDEGSVVTKDQVLARLESADVAAAMHRAEADLTEAEAAIAEARARHGEAQARVREAAAETLDAERALARTRALIDQRFVAGEVHDAALARHDRAQAAGASAAAGVVAAAAGIAAAEARRGAALAALDEARVAVSYTLIRAPFDGVILSKHADIGDVLAPFAAATDSKGAVLTMADLTTLQVEADISESNLTGVTVGQPCEIQLDALPDVRLRGEVGMIVPTVDRTKATVLAKVRFIERDPRVLPDMSARVAFLSAPLEPAEQRARTVVPVTAVVERGGASMVYRIDGEVARAVPVTLGALLGDQREVVDGLALGDKVVLTPPADLADGARVRAQAP